MGIVPLGAVEVRPSHPVRYCPPQLDTSWGRGGLFDRTPPLLYRWTSEHDRVTRCPMGLKLRSWHEETLPIVHVHVDDIVWRRNWMLHVVHNCMMTECFMWLRKSTRGSVSELLFPN